MSSICRPIRPEPRLAPATGHHFAGSSCGSKRDGDPLENTAVKRTRVLGTSSAFVPYRKLFRPRDVPQDPRPSHSILCPLSTAGHSAFAVVSVNKNTSTTSSRGASHDACDALLPVHRTELLPSAECGLMGPLPMPYALHTVSPTAAIFPLTDSPRLVLTPTKGSVSSILYTGGAPTATATSSPPGSAVASARADVPTPTTETPTADTLTRPTPCTLPPPSDQTTHATSSSGRTNRRTSRTRTGKADRPHACPHCTSRFKGSGNLKRHMRRHTGEKPFGCPYCDKRFSRSGNRTAHVRCHTGERPYVCQVCGRAFNQGSHLTTHMRCCHSHMDPKNPMGRPGPTRVQQPNGQGSVSVRSDP